MPNAALDILCDTLNAALTVTERMTVSDWADAHRMIDRKIAIDGVGGNYCTDNAPYAREMMNAFSDTRCTDLTFITGTQLGKTSCLENMLGYASAMDPGTAFWLMPDEKTARKIAIDRIIPMYRKSPELTKLMTEFKDDANGIAVRLRNMNIYFPWAGSAAACCSFPGRYVIADEIDKNSAFCGKEAPGLLLIIERVKNFWNRKIATASTPTTRYGPIYIRWCASLRHKYFVPCPHCGEMQTLEWQHIKILDGETDPERIRSLGLAWYECPHCHYCIREPEKKAMLAAGEWRVVDDKGVWTGEALDEARKRSRHWGFHLSSLYSPWVSWSDAKAEHLEAIQSGDRAALMNFWNSWLAEIWEETITAIRDETILELLNDYSPGIVPSWAQYLFAGSDVQLDRIYATVRAWGAGERSQLIWDVNISGGMFFQLGEQILGRTFQREQGGEMKVQCQAVDRGYRTDEVDKYCRAWGQRARGVKGESDPQAAPYRALAIDREITSGHVMPGGMMYWRVDNGYYMDWIARLLQARDPVLWCLNAQSSIEYCEHLSSRMKVIDRSRQKVREVWTQKPGHPQDHFLDCEVYALAVADMHYVRMLQDSGSRRSGQTYNAPPAQAGGGGWTIGR